ncbi:MAG: DNA repair protein RadA [Bacteroidetes bacterium HGW-Bacteroidetes-21]|nr:MAG: DNA repair protein RadA [Bacteroidetes bacterium HGW-Bacteroidetes-21]
MAKTKSVFICRECGAESPKWVGKCFACGEWNSFAEEVKFTGKTVNKSAGLLVSRVESKPMLLSEISTDKIERIDTRSVEFNRVLGGGIVPGSVVLIGGEPGIGKSTLMLQFALRVGSLKTLYVSGEESEEQIKLRATRISGKGLSCYIYCETRLEKILEQCVAQTPDLIVVDSIQTIYSDTFESAPGSVTQVRECATALLRFAKENGKPVFLIGHINKEGHLAGPKVLEHIVDTVLHFEGDGHHSYRMLRALKNRFGPGNEIALFDMQNSGLREITNPSEILLSQGDEPYSGTAVGAAMEGLRPLFIEVQSLVSPTSYGVLQRSSSGYDSKRLNMIIAVLEKRGGHKLAGKDIFVNIAGGLKVNDPAMDLPVMAGMISSVYDRPLPSKSCFCGEISLTGEIRAVQKIDQRLAEAEKLGFTKFFLSKYNKITTQKNSKISPVYVTTVDELLAKLMH